MQKTTMAYLLTALMVFTAVVYFVAAAEESEEAGDSQETEQTPVTSGDSENEETINSPANQEEHEESEEDTLATQVQTVFFTAIGLGYAGVGVWILRDKGRTNAPYIVAIGGSIAMIGLYVASRTINLPIVGLQEDVGTIDILSKVLQVGIVGLAAYMLNTNKVVRSVYNR